MITLSRCGGDRFDSLFSVTGKNRKDLIRVYPWNSIKPSCVVPVVVIVHKYYYLFLCALFYSYEKYVAFCVGVYKQRHNEKLLQWFIYVRKWNVIEKKSNAFKLMCDKWNRFLSMLTCLIHREDTFDRKRQCAPKINLF